MHHELDLAIGLDALNRQLSNRLVRLPDNLADLLLLVLVGVEVRVFLGGLLLLGLGLGLGDLDVTGAFADADKNVTSFLGSSILSNTAGGKGRLGVQERSEFSLVARVEFNANGALEVRGGGNHGVNGLLDVFLVEFGDQGGLNGCTTGGQLGGVDSTGGGRRSEDIGLLGEDIADQLSDLRGVRSTTREDDLD